jgi:hypothetical protein
VCIDFQAEGVAKSLRSQANPSRSKAVIASRPKTRYVVGFGAKPLIAARDLLSDHAFDSLIRRASGHPN